MEDYKLNNNSVCITEGCVRAAALVIENMNPDADPCEDFHEFACGRFNKRNQEDIFRKMRASMKNRPEAILEEWNAYDVELKRFEPVHTMYDGCKRFKAMTDTTELFRNYARDNFGWVPMLNMGKEMKSPGFTSIMTAFTTQIYMPLFDRIYAGSTSIHLNFPGYLKLGADMQRLERVAFLAPIDVRKLMALRLRDKELKELNDDTKVTITADSEEKLRGTISLLAGLKEETLRNFFFLEWFQQIQDAVELITTQEESCVRWVTASYRHLLTHFFATRRRNPSNDASALELAQKVRGGFHMLLNNHAQLGAKDREEMEVKLDSVNLKIGGDAELLNATFMQQFYDWGGYTSNKSFIDQVFKNQIDLPLKESPLMLDPTSETAEYRPEAHIIELGSFFFTSPFFEHDWPMEAKFAGLGDVIAREYAHSIDGSKGGILDDRTKLRIRQGCITDRFGQKAFLDEKMMMTNEKVLNETYMDDWVERQVWEPPRWPGLQEYAPHQRFFLAQAQKYCGRRLEMAWGEKPGPFRVNIMYANIPQFVQTFSCSKESKMNLVNRC
ncbi:unnamed protein product, partial [Mesorhabditis spiculigera]